MRCLKPIVSAALAVALVIPTSAIQACPAFLGASSVLPAVEGVRRNIRLFSLDKNSEWIEQALQVEAINEENLIVFEEDKDPNDGETLKTDRIVFRTEHFGPKASPKQPMPCQTKILMELQNPTQKGAYAYIASCKAPQPKMPPAVVHSTEKMIFKSPRYSFEYLPNNQLMYKEILVTHPLTGKPLSAAKSANMLLHLDVKKFFTLNMDNDNVLSEVTGSWTGPVGSISNISFFLKLLFFSINLKMDTSVGFYGDSALLPMIFEAPVNSPKVLHPGSGVLYHWDSSDGKVDQSNPILTLPNATPKLNLGDFKELAKEGLKYCKGDPCVYVLKGDLADLEFKIDIMIPRYMVEVGFFPQFVANTVEFGKQMEWDMPEETKPAIAIYFENSGLPKGFHRMDQWIRVGAKDSEYSCPRKVTVTKAVTKSPLQ